MQNPVSPEPVSPENTPHLPDLTLTQQFRLLGSLLRQSDQFLKLCLVSVALLGILLATAYGQVTLNQWNVPFYNAIEQRNVPEFIKQLQIFLIIAGCLLVLNVAQGWFQQTLAIVLRKAIVQNLIDLWLNGNNVFKLGTSGIYAQNPDQRIHQDTRQLADSTTGLVVGFVQSTILLISFIGILWNVSEGFVFHYKGQAFSLPGYMVWAVFIYVGLASLFSQMIGRGLIKLNAGREAKEAEFRSALVTTISQTRDGTKPEVTTQEIGVLRANFQSLYQNMQKLILAETKLTWISSGFGWLAVVVPILAAAPIYFSGTINFGGLMMAVGAFNQVYAALRWYVNNYLAIAEWRAHLLRILGFRVMLTKL